jgi:hypothetical protein
VLKDDPYRQPECKLTDADEPCEVYVKPRLLRTLLDLCLLAVATNLAKLTEPGQGQQLGKLTSDHATHIHTHHMRTCALDLT